MSFPLVWLENTSSLNSHVACQDTSSIGRRRFSPQHQSGLYCNSPHGILDKCTQARIHSCSSVESRCLAWHALFHKGTYTNRPCQPFLNPSGNLYHGNCLYISPRRIYSSWQCIYGVDP